MALEHGHTPFTRSDDLAYEFVTTLQITGVCQAPVKRKGEKFSISITGRELHAGERSLTLKDFQARDEHWLPKYRMYRGEQIPVYDPPRGFGLLTRERGTGIWRAWLWVPPYLVSDMLSLLSRDRPLFLRIHEYKSGRDRWIKRFSLQTTLPEEE